MNKKLYYYLIGAVLILVFTGFSYSAFQESLTPYVSYDKAREANRTVQVAGGLAKGSSRYDEKSQALHFTLTEPEGADTLKVRYHGLKPANFEDAVSIVAIGRFEAESGEMVADKLLVKCPSKYQGLESTETKTYGG